MKKAYNDEFRRSAVALVLEQNYTAKEAARNLGVHYTTVKHWVRKHRSEHGTPSHTGAGQPIDLAKRVAELEKENARLKMEREILKKATAYFAKDQL